MKLFGFDIDRLWIEVAGVVLLVALILGWWADHNHNERKIGAVACETQVESVGEKQTIDTKAADQEHAELLRRVSDGYDQQIATITADRDSLAQRLHDIAAQGGVRPGPVSKVPSPAVRVCTPPHDTRPTDSDRRLAADLEVCAKNAVELNAMRQAWAELAR